MRQADGNYFCFLHMYTLQLAEDGVIDVSQPATLSVAAGQNKKLQKKNLKNL